MHRFIAYSILLIVVYPFSLTGQSAVADSVNLYVLSEVVVESTSEEDTLMNFVRANRSATTEDILSRLQGVSLMRRGSYGQEPLIQGMSGGQLNVTIDGMKMFGACTDKMDPITIYIEPQNLSSISVLHGSNGAITGSTVGGSIDLKLSPPRFLSSRVSGTAGIGYHKVSRSMNTYFNTNLTTSNVAYNLNLSYRKANNYFDGEGKPVNYTQYNKLNFSGGAKIVVGQDTLSANVLVDNGWNIGFAALPMDVGSARASIYALTYRRTRCHGPIEDIKVKGYYNTVFHRMDDTHRQDVPMHMDMPGINRTSGIFGEVKLAAIGQHLIFVRGDVYQTAAKAEMIMYPEGSLPMYLQTWPESRRVTTGIYVEDRYRISSGTTIKSSVRMDLNSSVIRPGPGRNQLEIFYPGLSVSRTCVAKTISTGIRQRLLQSVLGELRIGYAERTPSLSESYGFYLYNRSDGSDYIGNPMLNLEKSWSGDLAVSYFGNIIQVNATGFYKFLPDYIQASFSPEINPMTPGANGVKVYNNIKSATFTGGDLTVLAKVTDQIKVVSVTRYLVARDYDQKPLPFISPFSNLTSVRFDWQPWDFQLECDLSAKQSRINASFGEDMTTGYIVFNFRTQYNWTAKRLLVNMGVENIFDRMYHGHLDWANIPRPGRNMYMTLSYRF